MFGFTVFSFINNLVINVKKGIIEMSHDMVPHTVCQVSHTLYTKSILTAATDDLNTIKRVYVFMTINGINANWYNKEAAWK